MFQVGWNIVSCNRLVLFEIELMFVIVSTWIFINLYIIIPTVGVGKL